MDLLGSYASDSDDEQQPTSTAAAAAPRSDPPPVPTPTAAAVTVAAPLLQSHAAPHSLSSLPAPSLVQPAGFQLHLASLLPAAQTHTPAQAGGDGTLGGEEAAAAAAAARDAKKRKKAEKAEKRERKRQKAAEANESEAASTAGLAPIPPALAPIPSSAPLAPSSAAFGLSAMLPPPKFDRGPPARPSYMEATPYARPAAAAPSVTPAAAAAAVPDAPSAQTHAAASSVAAAATATSANDAPTATAAPRGPPGMRAPPGMKAPATAASAAPPASSSSSSAAPSSAAPASYDDALAAAAAVAAAAGLTAADDAIQEQTNAALAQNPHILDDDAGVPYVPLYARAQAQAKTHVNAIGDVKGQDKFFKRAASSGVNFLTVNQDDALQRSLAEQLMAAYDEKGGPPIPGATKVQAKFWNSQTGQEESKGEVSRNQKTKHQINALASNAAAIEVEMARQRQAGYAKRDSARAKYGW